EWACKAALEFAWRRGLSAIPPEMAPYMLGESIMRTERLRNFLGRDHEEVIRYTVEDAFRESLGGLAQPDAVRHTATVWLAAANEWVSSSQILLVVLRRRTRRVLPSCPFRADAAGSARSPRSRHHSTCL